MNNCAHIINYSEARDEAERLSRTLKRNVEVAAVSCPCDYSKECYCCAGSGTYYELRYGFCNHVVRDGTDEECYEDYCAERERVAAIVEADPPPSHAPLKSCKEVQSEQDAKEAA